MNRRMMSPTDGLILAPESNDGAEDMYATEEANFNTNMVLILAALLCSLLFVLGLNAVARCTLRCRRRLGSDGARRTCSVGLKKNALRKIPVVVYGSDGAGICPATECPICLGEFEDGETVRVLPQCNHGFHVGCIDTWLVAHPSCPTCRHSLVDQPVMPPVIWASAGDRRV